MRIRFPLLATIVLTALGCAEALGLGDFGPADAAGGAGATSATDAGVGGDTDCGRCRPAPPAGWEGPVAATFGFDPDVTCDTAYPTPVFGTALGFGSLGGPADCGPCTCSPPQAEGCGPVEVTSFSTTDCAGVGSTFVVTDPCVANGGPRWKVAPVPSTGSCEATGGDVVDAPLPFGQWVALCEAPDHAAPCAGDEVCLPPPSDPANTSLCVHRTGEWTCPPGFDSAFLTASAWTDERTCMCECAFEPGTCATFIQGFQPGDCGGPVVGGISTNDPGCQDILGSVGSLRISNQDAPSGAACAKTEGPTGEVAVTERVTVCCAAP